MRPRLPLLPCLLAVALCAVWSEGRIIPSFAMPTPLVPRQMADIPVEEDSQEGALDVGGVVGGVEAGVGVVDEFDLAYSDETNYDYTYGDPSYDYGEGGRRQEVDITPGGRRQGGTAGGVGGAKTGGVEGEKGGVSFEFTYGDTYDYDYTYGDPSYEYGAGQDGEQRPVDQEDDYIDEDDDEDEEEEEDDDDDDEDVEGVVAGTTFDDDRLRTTTRRPVGPIPGQRSSVFDKFRVFWRRTQEELTWMMGMMEKLMVKIDALARRGLDYCVEKFHVIKEKASDLSEKAEEVVEKLKKLMKEGNKQVQQLLSLLGGKADRWNQLNQPYVPDAVIVSVGSDGSEVRADIGDGVSAASERMPNFFEDADVEELLEQLIESKVLTLEDVKTIQRASYSAQPSRDE